MRAIGLSIAALAACLGVAIGIAAPDTTPVDPEPFLAANDGGGGNGDGDDGGDRGGGR